MGVHTLWKSGRTQDILRKELTKWDLYMYNSSGHRQRQRLDIQQHSNHLLLHNFCMTWGLSIYHTPHQ